MIFDGFFLYYLIQELNQKLSKARLEKIYQTGQWTFVFIFYLNGERMQFKIDLSPHHFSMYITEQKAEVTLNSQFLMTLKKQLEGSILDQITQHETDRVAIFHFTTYDYIDGPIPKELVFEAMGKHSNLILTKDQIIIESFKKMFFEEGRQLIPMAHFEFFPSHKLPFFHIDYHHIENPKDIINQYMGVSPSLASYLFETKKQVLDIPLKPTLDLVSNKGYVSDIFLDQVVKQYFNSISLLLDQRVDLKPKQESSHAHFIDKQIKKYQLKIEEADLKKKESMTMLDEKTNGDLIYSSHVDLKEKRSDLVVNGVKIILDPLLTLNENAQAFYKRYQKAKRSFEFIDEQIKHSKDMLALFESFKTYLDLSPREHLADLEEELILYGYKPKQKNQVKKKHKKPIITRLSENGYHYLIGRNSTQNEYITHQLAQKEDYWFHVKDAPGGHIVVTTDQLNEHIIRKAAMLAAYFSSLKQSSSIPVDYTMIKHVKKISGTPGYHVTYKQHQTIFIDIDEEKIESYLKNV